MVDPDSYLVAEEDGPAEESWTMGGLRAFPGDNAIMYLTTSISMACAMTRSWSSRRTGQMARRDITSTL
jgi:hypothetical protein